MTNEQQIRLRRYVLGESPEDECEAVERDYFERPDVLDQVCAAEDGLIDDYLWDRLRHAERDRFERHYLSTPNHRRRVAVVRRIRTAVVNACLEAEVNGRGDHSSTRGAPETRCTMVGLGGGIGRARWRGNMVSQVTLG